MKISFLLDEHLPLLLKALLERKDATLDVLRVGDSGAPALGAEDPHILDYLEQSGRTLITRNRATMGRHAEAHLVKGGHFNGVFRIRPDTTANQLADEMYLLWSASEAEEWRDVIAWLPL
jgi:hypothetical protein